MGVAAFYGLGVVRKLTYSVPEAAEAIGISPWTYYRKAAEGALPVRKVGRRQVVPIKLLEEWVEGRASGPPRDAKTER